ncbi:MAG: adenylate/guanylate cyclase domain-containing protein [Cellulomonas sp.]|nr:adenylate/guanylate cyclase domain-containing protein [Cellulomonas sp.]
MKNGGVYLDAVYLYADMADSTGMARRFTSPTAAKIVRAYLASATRVLRDRDGEIRSFDGDRVMAIFVGSDAATRAVRAALELNWVVNNVVRDALNLWLDEYYESDWVLGHRCGIDIGTALIVRAGVRNSNDLVSIGDAPNIAAKLSELSGATTFITDRVWDAASYAACFTDHKPMWTDAVWTDLGGGRLEKVRSSSWVWTVN